MATLVNNFDFDPPAEIMEALSLESRLDPGATLEENDEDPETIASVNLSEGEEATENADLEEEYIMEDIPIAPNRKAKAKASGGHPSSSSSSTAKVKAKAASRRRYADQPEEE